MAQYNTTASNTFGHGLSEWRLTDRPKMDDFNADNELLNGSAMWKAEYDNSENKGSSKYIFSAANHKLHNYPEDASKPFPVLDGDSVLTAINKVEKGVARQTVTHELGVEAYNWNGGGIDVKIPGTENYSVNSTVLISPHSNTTGSWAVLEQYFNALFACGPLEVDPATRQLKVRVNCYGVRPWQRITFNIVVLGDGDLMKKTAGGM